MERKFRCATGGYEFSLVYRAGMQGAQLRCPKCGGLVHRADPGGRGGCGRGARSRGVNMKVAITAQGDDLASAVDPRFGCCRYLILSDTAAGTWRAAPTRHWGNPAAPASPWPSPGPGKG